MRLLKIIIFTLVILLIIAIVAISVIIKNFDINQYKEDITFQLSRVLNRDVLIDNMNLTLSLENGASLDVEKVSIADHPAFSKKLMVEVAKVRLNVDLLHFLSDRELLISHIELHSPKINLVKNQDGAFNILEIAGPGHSGTDQKSLPGSENIPAESASAHRTDIQLPAFLIHSVQIIGGAFRFTDRSTEPATVIPVEHISFQTTNLSLNRPFRFKLSGALWNDKENLALNGLVRLNEKTRQVRIDDMQIKTDLESFALEEILKDIPALRAAGLSGKLKGQADIAIPQIIIGADGVTVVSAEGRLTDGQIHHTHFKHTVDNIDLHFSVQKNNLMIHELFMYLASGKVMLKGRLQDLFGRQLFSLDLNAEDIRVDELVPKEQLPFVMTGKLFSQYKVQGAGLTADQLQQSLTGQGTLELKEGKLLNFNLLKVVLNGISPIPNLVTIIENNVPQKYKALLAAKDTDIKQMLCDTNIRDGRVFVSKSEVNVDGYIFSANGSLDFKQNLKLGANLDLDQDLSARFVDAAGDLIYLMDTNNQIHIPIKLYEGPAQSYKPVPDIAGLSKQIIKTRGQQELKKVIFKALDIEEPAGPSTQTKDVGPVDDLGVDTDTQIGPPPEKPSTEEVIIENILDAILK